MFWRYLYPAKEETWKSLILFSMENIKLASVERIDSSTVQITTFHSSCKFKNNAKIFYEDNEKIIILGLTEECNPSKLTFKKSIFPGCLYIVTLREYLQHSHYKTQYAIVK